MPALLQEAQWLWLLIWLIAFSVSDYFAVAFDVGESSVGMTLAEALLIFLVPTAGFESIIIVACATFFVEALQRRVWYRALFNVAQRVIVVFAMVATYQVFHDPAAIPFSSVSETFAFMAISLIHYAINTILVGTVVALATRAPITSVYKQSYRPVQWIHLLTLPIGALMAAHWASNRWLLIFDVLVLLIAQRSFLAVAQLQQESQRRHELADERGRLLEELRVRQEDLIRSSKLAALGTFSSGIAHELGNLLSAVIGQTQLGLLTNDREEMRESLQNTLKACQRGRTITKELLTFARQGENQRIMTQLQEVIEDTLLMTQHDFEQAQVQVVRQFQPLPPTACDPGQIMQVLLNLLTNARDAMPPSGGQIIVSTRCEAERIVMTIADTGSGMPPDLLEKVFEPFVTTKGAQGTGLGLAICYGIITNHKGDIRVVSAPGQGTTMTITLPVSEQAEPGIVLSQQDILRLETAEALGV
ncbi:MAG: hypothetical protein H7Z42_05155 [Roseiflexaceae bacterium]|nr:hypothetical protein [Roseiflexaceae bacterium]